MSEQAGYFVEGLVIATLAFSLTFVCIAAVGLSVVLTRIHEERNGNGCRSAGCRRSRSGNGCDRSRMAEPVRDSFNGGK